MKIEIGVDHRARGELVLDRLECIGPVRVSSVAGLVVPKYLRGEVLGILGLEESTVTTGLDEIERANSPWAYDGLAADHGLEAYAPEGFQGWAAADGRGVYCLEAGGDLLVSGRDVATPGSAVFGAGLVGRG